jgi:hypothetical protein
VRPFAIICLPTTEDCVSPIPTDDPLPTLAYLCGYHCTGYADKCQGQPDSCRRKYVREEVLEAQFTKLNRRMSHRAS